MMMPKPVRPPPVIAPSSVWVKPYCSAHCPRMPARIENPTPEAMMAMNPAQSRRYALGAAVSAELMEDLLTREGVCPGLVRRRESSYPRRTGAAMVHQGLDHP